MDRSVSNTVRLTPKRFVHAMVQKFGPIEWDLAANAEHTVAPNFFDIQQDSLAQDWTKCTGLKYCNMPFDRIGPWVEKAHEWKEKLFPIGDAKSLLLLVPGSIDSNWWEEHVHEHCFEWRLKGRVPFYPDKPKWGFPKPLVLLEYHPCVQPGVGYWDWR